MDINLIQIIIQGGSVGVAVFALYVLFKLVGNHIEHSTRAIKDLTVVLTRLEEFLRDTLK